MQHRRADSANRLFRAAAAVVMVTFFQSELRVDRALRSLNYQLFKSEYIMLYWVI